MSDLNQTDTQLQNALQKIEDGQAIDTVLREMDDTTRRDIEPLLRLALHMKGMSHPAPPKAKNIPKRIPANTGQTRSRRLLRLGASAAMLVLLAGLLLVAYSMMNAPQPQPLSDMRDAAPDNPGLTATFFIEQSTATAVAHATNRAQGILTPTPTPDALSQTATARIQLITETVIAQQENSSDESVPPTPDALSQTATAIVQQITVTVQAQESATAQANREACPMPPGWTTYRIQRGDTFLRLASDYAVTVEQIARANCFDRDTPPLEEGQMIYIPAASTPTAIALEMAQTAMAQPDTAPSLRADDLSVADETTVYATAQDFENGVMIYRNDSGTIYALLDNGDAQIYETQTYGEWPLNTDDIAPDGYQAAINGFGQIWLHEDELRESMGGATGREIGFQMPITRYTNGTVDLYQLNGSMYRVQGDSWTQFP